jgi:hypothetical protein
MTAWILIVSWAVNAGGYPNATYYSASQSHAVAMQEFENLRLCQHASVEAAKIAPGIRVVCVPKGEQK